MPQRFPQCLPRKRSYDLVNETQFFKRKQLLKIMILGGILGTSIMGLSLFGDFHYGTQSSDLGCKRKHISELSVICKMKLKFWGQNTVSVSGWIHVNLMHIGFIS